MLAQQLISYGSCQFPTLGFVVERFKAIQAFVPEVFHRIKGKAQGLCCRICMPQEDKGAAELKSRHGYCSALLPFPAHVQILKGPSCVQTPLVFHCETPVSIYHGFSETASVCLQ